MKHSTFTLLLTILLGWVATSASAHDIAVANDDGVTIYYVFNSDKTELSVSCLGSDVGEYSNEYHGSVVIPSSVTYKGKSYSVTSIRGSAFEDCIVLKSVTIPSSVTRIGGRAFRNCSGLTSVTIPESIISIGERAFSGCSSLTSVTIPEGVTSINGFVFSGCSSLISVTIPESVTSIDGSAFYGCSSLTSVTIPESVTSIGYGAFYNCGGLTSITIPEGVTTIGNNAFCNCNGLTSVIVAEGNAIYDSHNGCNVIIETASNTLLWGCMNSSIPEGVTTIGNNAFYNCSGLTSITIPESVTTIGDDAFYNCSGLTSVTIPEGVTTIGNNAFAGCSGLTSVTIPEGVTTIGDGAFYNCSGLTSVTIPESVTHIGSSAFSGTAWYNAQPNGLVYAGKVAYKYKGTMPANTSIVIKGGTREIGNGAFYNCNGLTSITIPEGVTSIGDFAFEGCGGLTSVTIPNSLTLIGSSAFSGCSGLTSVTIPNSLTLIGSSAFSGCSGLTSVTINSNAVASKIYSKSSTLANIFGTQVENYVLGDDVQSIGAYACYGCSELTSVTIGNSLTEIGSYAFYGCSGLTSVTINSNAVVSKGYDNFSTLARIFGSQVKNYIFGDAVQSIGEYACYGCSDLASVTIGSSVNLIGESAFYGCSGLTAVTIGDSVTEIGYSAFYGCSGLTSVTINSNALVSKGYYNFSTLAGIFGSQVKNYIFVDAVQSIGEYACYGCSELTSVTIGNSVTEIGSYAFSGCSGLTSIVVESGNPKYNSHNNCNAIIETESNTLVLGCKSTIIPNSVTGIGKAAFYGCGGLTSVIIPEGVISIGDRAFSDCSGLRSVSIPHSITEIGIEAFRGCSGLTSITVAEGNTIYDSRNRCNAIIKTASNTLITGCMNTIIPESVTSIGSYAFEGCSRLRTVTIHESVTSIYMSAFSGCIGLTSVTINNNAIASKTYRSSFSLANVFGTQVKNYVFGDAVQSIGAYACYGCSDLTSVIIGNSVTEIGCYAFEDCSSLTSVTINSNALVSKRYYKSSTLAGIFGSQIKNYIFGDAVQSIGEYACYGCSDLTSVTIGNSVTEIGSYAFEGCSGLVKAGFASVESLCGIKFSTLTSNPLYYVHHLYIDGWELQDLVIPNSVICIGNYAFYNCSGLTSVTIPNNVTEIGNFAFSDCSNVTALEIHSNTLTNIGEHAFDNCSKMNIYVNNGSATLLAVWAKEIVPYDIMTKERLDASSTIVVQEQTATALTAKLDDLFGDYESQLFINGNPMKRTETFMQMGLDPDTEYTISGTIALVDQDEGTILSCALPGQISVATTSLVFETLQPKVVTEGNVVVESISNIQYDEEKAGVEWRRTDWTDDFPSNSATAYLFNGTIQGYIRNLNTNYLWKFRAFYESASGNRYYSGWMGIDPTNTSYFEPTVHTYAVHSVEGNQAQVKGYALTGTDKVTSQGFAYWRVSANTKAKMNEAPAKVISVPDDVQTVTAKGTVMEASLTGLEYNATYCYVAYVTTSEGETFYGEQQSFTTGEDLTHVESIVNEPAAVNIVAIYDASGRKQPRMQHGVNIVRMSDGTVRKIMMK